MVEEITLELFKQHTRTDDTDWDDAKLEQSLKSAKRFVLRATHRTEEELREMEGGEFPPPLTEAILLIGGLFYEQRQEGSAVQLHQLPFGAAAAIKQYRRLV